MTPRISIVLPTHNGALYLDEAIRSCVGQTCENWEVVIVDDASTDRTPEIIAEHAARDARIRSVRSGTTLRLPAALNAGFSRARGDYLTWTSDDNLFRPHALAEMAGALDGDAGADIVYAGYTRIDEAGRPTGRGEIGPPEAIFLGNCIGPCFLFRRAVAEALGGYSEDLFLAEDYDFWLRAFPSFRFRPLDRDLYLYRDHGGSLTRRNARSVLKATEHALRRRFAGSSAPDRRIRADGWLSLARRAMACREADLAKKYFLYAASSAPGYVYRTARFAFTLESGPAELERLLAQRDRRILKILNSTSWRVTAPLRWLGGLVAERTKRPGR